MCGKLSDISIDYEEFIRRLKLEYQVGYDRGFVEGSKWGIEQIIKYKATELPKPIIIKSDEVEDD